jgi:hypothetical protein
MNYYLKYLKYKNKYLKEKQTGGNLQIQQIASTIFYFSQSMPSQYKINFTVDVIKLSRQTNTIPNLQTNNSAEGGFELPMTQEWLAILFMNPYVKYHAARQLRFIEQNNQIIGLRCKDNIPYFTQLEIDSILEVCNSIIPNYVSTFIPFTSTSGSTLPPTASPYSPQSPIISQLSSINTPTYMITPPAANTVLSLNNATYNQYPYNKIKFNKPIAAKHKKMLMVNTLLKAKKTSILQNLDLLPGSEGGFALPINSGWMAMLNNQTKTRNLVFIHKKDKIVGLKFIYEISWTTDEVEELLDIIYEVKTKLNKSGSK